MGPWKGRWRLDTKVSLPRVRLNFKTEAEARKAEAEIRRKRKAFAEALRMLTQRATRAEIEISDETWRLASGWVLCGEKRGFYAQMRGILPL
jgi:hypothetical protein